MSNIMSFEQVKVRELLKLEIDHYERIEGKKAGYQRQINDGHKNKISKILIDKILNKKTLEMVPLYISKRENNEEYIIDGQHRVSALKKIKEDLKNDNELSNDFKDKKITFEDVEFNVIYVAIENDNLEKEIFLQLNYYGKNVNSSLATVIETEIGNLSSSQRKAVNLINMLDEKENLLKGKFNIGPSERGKLSYRSLYTTLSTLFNKEFEDLTEEQIFSFYCLTYEMMKQKWEEPTGNIYKNVGWFTLYYLIKLLWNNGKTYDDNKDYILKVIINNKITEKDWSPTGEILKGSSMSYFKSNAETIIDNFDIN